MTKSHKKGEVGWIRFATSYLNAKSRISLQTFRDKYCFRTFHYRFPKDVYWNFQKMFQIRHRAKNGTADYGLTQCTDAQWRKNLSHFLTKLKLQSWKVMNWSESFAATSKLGDYYFVNRESMLFRWLLLFVLLLLQLLLLLLSVSISLSFFGRLLFCQQRFNIIPVVCAG